MNFRATDCETQFFSRECPKCGGYVNDGGGLLRLRPVFRCATCRQELKTEVRWRGALGIIYGVPAIALGSYLLGVAEPLLGAESLAFKAVQALVGLFVALPAGSLLFRGVV